MCCLDGDLKPHVHTAHNRQSVKLVDGDWVIPEPDGRGYYPCKDDIFRATYEPINERGEPLDWPAQPPTVGG